MRLCSSIGSISNPKLGVHRFEQVVHLADEVGGFDIGRALIVEDPALFCSRSSTPRQNRSMKPDRLPCFLTCSS